MRRSRKTQPVHAEVLESRLVLSSVSLVGSTLLVHGGNQADKLTVSEDLDAETVTVDLNGEVSTFDRLNVDSLVIFGGNGDDLLENRTSLNAVIFGDNGNDTIRGGSADDTMFGGNGNDRINDFGGSNMLVGGNGNDTLQSVASGRDVFLGGNGNDLIYAIVGEPNVALGGHGKDSFIVRDDVEITDARDNERVIAFRPGEAPGTLRDGVLYLGFGVGGDIVVSEDGNQIVANVNGEVSTFDRGDVVAIAGVGSLGDDRFENNTRIDSVFYGSAGDDVLIGGDGDDLLKGGGGDDVILGRGGDDDLAGDSGADTIDGGLGRDVLRVDALDLFFAQRDDDVIFQ